MMPVTVKHVRLIVSVQVLQTLVKNAREIKLTISRTLAVPHVIIVDQTVSNVRMTEPVSNVELDTFLMVVTIKNVLLVHKTVMIVNTQTEKLFAKAVDAITDTTMTVPQSEVNVNNVTQARIFPDVAAMKPQEFSNVVLLPNQPTLISHTPLPTIESKTKTVLLFVIKTLKNAKK